MSKTTTTDLNLVDDMNEIDIVEAIKQYADAYSRLGQAKSQYSEILKWGREFPAAPLPEYVERGTPRECFQNCLNIADDANLIYCEGFAIRPSLGMLIHHAWCIDPDTEEVVDPTWERPEECKYFGIDLQMSWMINHEYTGMGLEQFLIEKDKEEQEKEHQD
jgi:hypothetical protein